ncbi:DUF1156 domain-containing protein [Stieleria sp. JC731]|uniref:DUF1156 domain-containing protein n=1 Tax=Pirellulaceae TaxID=2691357 RepID=UPI001E5618D9|nr:DUF1156 domain-containing protein [Stieleria sp. JC731]MCC9601011.1 DUF1156 domain-containing protein [Stieleria sp. JC731]
MTHEIKSPKKLIEVALPLDAINAASAREKSIRHGHPSTLHLWWARRPLAAARAVIFSQLVHDPEDLWYYQNPGKEPNKQVRGHWTKSRARLFKIIEDLVLWENTTNEEVLNVARAEIRKSWAQTCELNNDHPQADELFDPDNMPGLHDPFAGGGTIPLEAQRLGLEAYASDLNPVPVLINKSLIEVPQKFEGLRPVNPESHRNRDLIDKVWSGANGLADDVRYYGEKLRELAEERIGHLYPKVKITKELAVERKSLEPYVGKEVTVIAWLWTRTVKSPNPAFSDVEVPLVTSFSLSKKPGKSAYVNPVISKEGYGFEIQDGETPEELKLGTKTSRGANFRCLMSNTTIEPAYIKKQAVAGKMGVKLMAIVAEGIRERIFLPPLEDHEVIARSVVRRDERSIHVPLANDPRNLWCLQYGLDHFDKLFTNRQFETLLTFSDLVGDIKDDVISDASKSMSITDSTKLSGGGNGPVAYGEAVSIYLAFAVDKVAEGSSVICSWSPLPTKLHVVSTFGRQALPMTWDYAESNVFADSSGNLSRMCKLIANALATQSPRHSSPSSSKQADAQSVELGGRFVSTDPPYYDNIGYADLSDYFYVWLRRSLRSVFPDLFATISVPKSEELIATPYRHESKDAAEHFFLDGMTEAMGNIARKTHPSYPVTIYYAFKQSDTGTSGTASTGWDTFLEAVNRAGLSVTGTWPMRTERAGGFRNKSQNSLASSIILVCRPKGTQADSVSRRDFIRELNATLPKALDAMTRESEDLPSPVAPVDLSQAVIGPGMAVYSKYSAVLEADGSPMTVRTALQLINRFLAEDDFDADTQFCLHWFDQCGWDAGVFGEADVLARAKATSVSGLVDAGVLRSGGGTVQLLRWNDFPADWDPQKDMRIPIWEVLHQLIRALRQGGESAAGKLLGCGNVQSRAEAARQLAYRLYTLCERKNWPEDARAYNELITSWTNIESATPQVIQTELF